MTKLVLHLPRLNEPVDLENLRAWRFIRETANFISNILIEVLRFLHKVYKVFVSPALGPHCRFHPSCSDYAIQALESHGLLRGSVLALQRVCSCNSLFEGGHDPVPTKARKKEIKTSDF